MRDPRTDATGAARADHVDRADMADTDRTGRADHEQQAGRARHPDHPDRPDHVDRVLEQWGEQRPDLDVSPMAVIGRVKRLMLLIEPSMKRTFAAHGLDAPSFDVLATLRRNGPDRPLTPAELMRSAMVTSGAITQRLDRLQERGLVTRTPSPTDGRVVQVGLTEQGLAVIDGALPDHLANEETLLAALPPAELEQLADSLRALLLGLGDGR